MSKLLYFMRYSLYIPIGIGVAMVCLFLAKQYTWSIWLAHIAFFIHYMPATYVLAITSSEKICHSDSEKTFKGLRKTTQLTPFLEKFFCTNYPRRMPIMLLVFECFLLAYSMVCVVFNLVFITSHVFRNADSRKWAIIWVGMIVVQIIMFNVARLTALAQDVYDRRTTQRSNKNARRHLWNSLKSDRLLSKRHQTIQRNVTIITSLKQYGLRYDKHKRYTIRRKDLEQLYEVLPKEFPQLRVNFSANEHGSQILELYHIADNGLVLQAYVKNK